MKTDVLMMMVIMTVMTMVMLMMMMMMVMMMRSFHGSTGQFKSTAPCVWARFLGHFGRPRRWLHRGFGARNHMFWCGAASATHSGSHWMHCHPMGRLGFLNVELDLSTLRGCPRKPLVHDPFVSPFATACLVRNSLFADSIYGAVDRSTGRTIGRASLLPCG